MKKLANPFVLAIACAFGTADACSLGLGPDFPEMVKLERSVFVFQVESLAVTGEGPPYSEAAGAIRVLRTLKGPAPQFRFIRIPIGFCGLRMQVGEAYVVATSQNGKLLELFPRGQSVLGLGPNYRPAASAQHDDRNRVLAEVRKIVKTGRTSAGFPSEYDLNLSPMALPPPPPPPPAETSKKGRS